MLYLPFIKRILPLWKWLILASDELYLKTVGNFQLKHYSLLTCLTNVCKVNVILYVLL